MTKEKLRARMKALRLALSEEERIAAARIAAENLRRLPRWKSAESVALYSPIKGELDPGFAARMALEEGKTLLYPRCEGERMDFFPVDDPARMKPGAFGIPEPEGNAPVTDFSRCLTVTPALAVDRNRFRLGWGGGFYDRFFAAHEVFCKVGFVYDFQLVDSAYPEEWDVRLDETVTS